MRQREVAEYMQRWPGHEGSRWYLFLISLGEASCPHCHVCHDVVTHEKYCFLKSQKPSHSGCLWKVPLSGVGTVWRQAARSVDLTWTTTWWVDAKCMDPSYHESSPASWQTDWTRGDALMKPKGTLKKWRGQVARVWTSARGWHRLQILSLLLLGGVSLDKSFVLSVLTSDMVKKLIVRPALQCGCGHETLYMERLACGTVAEWSLSLFLVWKEYY